MFDFRKNKRKKIKNFSRNLNNIINYQTNYQEVRIKLNTQLNKLKLAAKNNPGIILRINKKNFQDEKVPHELFLTTRQTIKKRNAFANNMSTAIKRSKTKRSKIIQSGGSFGSWLANLGKSQQIANK